MSDCIEHQGYAPRGYGRRSARHGTVLVHRQEWIEANGPIPEGMELHHLCGNKLCHNLDHLEPVSHAGNMAYERVVLASVVADIRAHKELHGFRDQELADFYGISRSYVNKLTNGVVRGGQ